MQTEDHKVKIDELEIYYRTAGDPEKQPIVFLHGWGARFGRSWLEYLFGTERVIKELSKHFYVIAPELPGLMRSEPSHTVWSLEDYADTLHKLLSPLKLKSPIIMGQSFGGAVGAIYAKMCPDNIRLLVLVDAMTSKRESNFFYRLRFRYVPLLQKIIRSRYTPFFFKKLIIFAGLGVPLAMVKKELSERYLIMGEIHRGHSINVDYKSLSMPLLLIWGDKDNYITPIKQAKEVHREVKGSKLILVKGGHSVLYFHPKRVIDAMLRGLA